MIMRISNCVGNRRKSIVVKNFSKVYRPIKRDSLYSASMTVKIYYYRRSTHLPVEFSVTESYNRETKEQNCVIVSFSFRLEYIKKKKKTTITLIILMYTRENSSFKTIAGARVTVTVS